MKNYNFWEKASRYSALIVIVLAIIRAFFRKYIVGYINVWLFLSVVVVLIFSISELMKFIIKRNRRSK